MQLDPADTPTGALAPTADAVGGGGVVSDPAAPAGSLTAVAAPPTVTVVPVATPAAAKPATPNIELYLHAIVIVAAICCLTVLGALKVIDGNTVGGEVAALGGVSAAVTTVATIRKGAASS